MLFRLILQFGRQIPIFLGLKRLNLPFPLHDEAERHRLHPAARKAALARGGRVVDFMIEQCGKLISHQPVEHAARLLRIYEAVIDLARVFQRLFDRLGGDLVEFDTVFLVFVQSEHRLQVPGDRLALAVGVGCEIDVIRLFRLVRQSADNVLLALRIDVFRLEIVFDIDAQRMDGQIADMPRRSVHFVLSLQVFRDGLCLGRRLYDD